MTEEKEEKDKAPKFLCFSLLVELPKILRHVSVSTRLQGSSTDGAPLCDNKRHPRNPSWLLFRLDWGHEGMQTRRRRDATAPASLCESEL